MFLVSLAVVDSVACVLIERWCRQRVKKDFQRLQGQSGNAKIEVLLARKKTDSSAADLEEKLLREEAKKNLKMVGMFAGVVGLMVVEAILRGP